MRSARWLAPLRAPLGQAAVLLCLCGVLVWMVVHPPLGVPSLISQKASPRHVVTRQPPIAQLRAPAGFTVGLYAAPLPAPRMLRFTAAGDLLVSSPLTGRVFLLRADRDHDGKADGTTELLTGLDMPHGLDLFGGFLYVAEGGAVFRVPFDERTGRTTGRKSYVVTGLPKGGGHWTRSLRIGPDQHLYVSVGSSCNVCRERDRRRAAILRYDLDGRNPMLYATGLRNSVGLAFQPGTGKLYATDNGRDLLGDDFPPCELNLIEQGAFYGWPLSSGNRVPDPDFGAGHEAEIAASHPPVHEFRAHNAPLGITFSAGAHLPPAYGGAALVALHGSWNRSQKDGYKVVALHFDGPAVREEDFLTGFLDGQRTLGRPVDVAVGPDGALYVSDDYAGAVYRVAYGQ